MEEERIEGRRNRRKEGNEGREKKKGGGGGGGNYNPRFEPGFPNLIFWWYNSHGRLQLFNNFGVNSIIG